MRPITTLLAMLLLSLPAAGCATSSSKSATLRSPANAELVAEIRAQCDGMERAMRANDMVGVASFYTDDALLFGPSGRTRGGNRDAVNAYWVNFGEGVDWQLSIHSLEGIEDLLVHRGTSVLTYRRDGQVRTSTVEYMLAWVREPDGELRIKVDAYW